MGVKGLYFDIIDTDTSPLTRGALVDTQNIMLRYIPAHAGSTLPLVVKEQASSLYLCLAAYSPIY
jgi:hypothetical protein